MAVKQPDSRRLAWINRTVFLLCLLPTVLLVWRVFDDGLGANPIEAAIRFCGRWALIMLLVTLAVTPLRRLTKLNWLLRLRRMLGLFAYYYASLHLLLFVGVDQFFDWPAIGEEIIERPFITIGMLVFTLLTTLALTSSVGMIRRLGGKRWQLLHRLIYPAAAGGVLHYIWLVKKDLSQPCLYAVILALLLLLRLKPLMSVLGRRRYAAH